MIQKKKRRTAEEWASIVACWRKSGLSAREFAGEQGLAPKSLIWWGSELSRRARKTQPKADAKKRTATVGKVEFAQVKVAEPRRGGGRLSVRHDSGFTIAVEGDVNAPALSAVLKAVLSC